MIRIGIAAVIATATFGTAALAAPANPSANAMKVCGAQYQAAKKAGKLPAGETWNQFLAQCRGGAAKPARVAAATPARAQPAAHKPAGPPSAAQKAMYERERQCGKMWQADKAAHRIPANEKWPQYWSACNKRVKG